MRHVLTQKMLALTVLAASQLLFTSLVMNTAWAVPALQIYIDGGVYDTDTETWVVETNNPFKLWVIGDIESNGTISDVKLAAAVLTDELPGSSIGLSPTTTSLVTDPSTPQVPTPTGNSPSVDGAVPVRGDGSLLAAHGIYGTGTSFFEWTLGDFTLTDSPVGDFIEMFPTSFPSNGQINVYEVTISGFSQVHFDTYDHIFDGDKHGEYKFAPFSHDGGATGNPVPEPGTWVLMGTGLFGLLGYTWRRKP